VNRAQYRSSLDKTKSLLNRLSMTKYILPGHRPVPYEYLELLKTHDYIAIYRKAIEEHNYDILLYDDSILQFSYNVDPSDRPLIRYSYCQVPFDFPDYKEYLLINGLTYEEAGELFIDEYEQELSEASRKLYYTPVRYDYCEDEYTCAVHSASHLHIGYQNSIRIPISLIITPYMFALFVLKQCYYSQWTELIKDSSFIRAVDLSKVSCLDIRPELFTDLDKKELFLK